MTSEARTRELVKGIYDAVIDMDEDGARDLCRKALDEGVDPYYAITEGLTAAMGRAGVLYSEKEYFVPELLLCSDALNAGLEVLKPHIKIGATSTRRKLIIGTVEGDIHDIGKNLVKIMFEAAGWQVHDLGKDVELSRFLEVHRELRADVIALSALMTTSMLAMPRVIKMVKAEDPDVAVMVGGAPLTEDIAAGYGADGFADNAGTAVAAAEAMLVRRRR